MRNDTLYSQGLSRRGMIRLLGLGAGLGLVSGRSRVDLAALPSASGAQNVAFPKGAIIRTILRDVSPESLGKGAVLIHEHVSHTREFMYDVIDVAGAKRRGVAPPPMPTEPYFTEDLHLPTAKKRLDLMVEEMRAAAKDGIACVVDAGHADMGRSIAGLRELSAKSGMPIVASGGYYREPYYPPRILSMSEDQIVEELVRDARAERWGALGEIGTSEDMTPNERKVLRAVGKAHLRTNLPIFTHTTGNKGGLEQLDLFLSLGIQPQHLVIGHMSASPSEVQKEIAKRGAFVGFDNVGREGEQGAKQDAGHEGRVLAFLEAGYADRLILSSDFGLTENAKYNGGNGLARAVTHFVPRLRKAGVKEETLRGILIDNPRRFLAFVPKT